ncbi:ABC transporter permease subunit [Agaribacter flavus]|uniref:ABC transporter permease subunit n=1 Tax=Agaribacter flavus TaxID=1902781 RepID=A0ABV7FKW0_9ALTE
MQRHTKLPQDIRRFRKDIIAKRIVTAFGWLVLLTFILLVTHILYNAFPLFKSPKLVFEASHIVSDKTRILELKQASEGLISLSYYKQIIDGDPRCGIELDELKSRQKSSIFNKQYSCDTQLSIIEGDSESAYASISAKGTVELTRLDHSGNRVQSVLFGSFDLPLVAKQHINILKDKQESPLNWRSKIYKDTLYLWVISSNQTLLRITKQLGSFEDADVYKQESVLFYHPLASLSQQLYLYDGRIELTNSAETVVQSIETNTTTTISVLPSERGLLLTKNTGFEVWGTRNTDGHFRFLKLHEHETDSYGQILSARLAREHAVIFALTDEAQLLMINNASFEIIARQALDTQATGMYVQGNDVYLSTPNKLFHYSAKDLQGAVTWKSLFEPLHYIGYETPSHVWQTSMSSADAQIKFGVIPLIVGSIKASLLALLVAVPLALGAAIYTAYFATNKIRAWIKPSIEMIEAIPAVIIGFIAAVWLAPFAERSLIAIFLLLTLSPFILFGIIALHGVIRNRYVHLVSSVYYVPLFCVVLGMIALIVYSGAYWVQEMFLHSPENAFTRFASNVTLTKTAIVVALALGIAITPTIYSLIDDALFEVPDGVKQAAFALGATELQTLGRVVLLVAMPSIISAVMLGFGRAFGETMIVLMVTGNTPIADWDLLSGLRSLTSNLAIELQEANVGSAHYHVLFLTAAILFAFTFTINSFAAMLKSRLQTRANHDF